MRGEIWSRLAGTRTRFFPSLPTAIGINLLVCGCVESGQKGICRTNGLKVLIMDLLSFGSQAKKLHRDKKEKVS
jgi:hypothetical protein